MEARVAPARRPGPLPTPALSLPLPRPAAAQVLHRQVAPAPRRPRCKECASPRHAPACPPPRALEPLPCRAVLTSMSRRGRVELAA